ncbi:MAG TPA: tetratricopeptide repeat protein, partial [Isosphaeraceae bacterium]|nr:tetratricopeptide repeat protein [Isosphaeraceae bacterium]
PDGRLVVAGGENGTIRAWDPATGDERASISDQLYPVDKMMFTPDSKFLVVGTRDGTVTFLSSSTWKFETVLTGHRDQIAFITISKDATRLFTGSRDGSVRIWQLPTRMEVVAFHTAGFKLGAGAYDPSGRGLVLGALNGQILFWSKASELDVGRYHIEVEEWSRAVADLSKAIAQGIDTSEVRFRRGVAFASLSRWKAAQDDLKRVHEATPADVIVGLTDAVLSLHLGDSASYRAVCADLVEAHEGNVDLFTTSAITWACVVGPGALDDPEKAVVQGRRAFAAQTGGYNLYSATGLGAALYRAGKFEEALAQLKRAVALHGTGTAYEWLFLAMTEHQLGHDKEAQEWYKKAADWVEQAKQQKVQDAFLNVPLSWMNTLSLELLLNEYGTMSKK